MIAATHSLSYVIEASLLFIPLILWIILVAYVFRDLFRNAEMSGVKKAWWVLAQFVLPLVGCLLYFLIHGGSMDQGATQLAAAHEETEAIRAAQIALESHAAEALEMAHAAFAAQSDQSELVAQAAQDAKAAQAALALQNEEMLALAQATQT